MNAPTPTVALSPPVPEPSLPEAVPPKPPAKTSPSKSVTPADLAALLDEPAPKAWYRRPALWGTIVAVVLLLAAPAWWWSNRAANAAPSYVVQPVARGNLTLTVMANGTVQPTRSINIGSELSGQINLTKASITAPADGVVLTRAVDPGNAVAAFLQAVTLFTVAEDLARLRLWVCVDEADVGAVKLGQSATFTVSAYPSRPFPARITRVGFGSTITDNVVTYLTYLDVDNADLSLRPGMTATATIVATERKDVLLVPNAALRFQPTAVVEAAKEGIASGIAFGLPKTDRRRKGAADSASTAGARRVWVLPQAGKGASAAPVAVAVTPGISDGRMTEITGGDLKVGVQLVTAQKTSVAP